MELDQIDCRILNVLQQDADLSNQALAERVGLSASACLRRVSRLKTSGVIARIVALVDPARINRKLTAVVTVEFSRHGSKHKRAFLSQAKQEPAVTQCYLVTGEMSCVLILQVAEMGEYLALSDKLFDQDDNVAFFRTYIVMQTVKQETALPVVPAEA